LKNVSRRVLWAIGIGIVAVYILVFYNYFVLPTGFRWKALYGDTNYPEGYEIEGCQVRFIVMKATEGVGVLDDNFNDNFFQAKEYGFIRGAYHFWSNKSTPREQAYYFLKQVHLEDGDLPPVLDVEHKPENRSVEAFQTDILTWLHIVEDKYHAKPIIYTNYKFKEDYLSAPVFDDYPYWIAHYYVKKVEYKGKWKFWQHTDVGQLSGIKGYVDFNIYNGSYYDLKKLTIDK
jgi:lysozyme